MRADIELDEEEYRGTRSSRKSLYGEEEEDNDLDSKVMMHGIWMILWIMDG